MKVLVNAISAKRGGIVTYSKNLIAALKVRGVDAVFAVPNEIACEYPENTIAAAASRYKPLQRLIWEQMRWRWQVHAFAPDVLFSSANFGLIYSPVPQVLLLREGGLFDRSYLTNIAPAQGANVAVMRYFRRQMMLLSARHSDHVITPSDAMRNMLLDWAPDVAAKTSVNAYGTPHNLYHPESTQRMWRADGMLRLIFVSVYYPHKNPSVLCAAVEQMNEAGLPAHATITMDIDETRIGGGVLDRLVLEAAATTGRISIGHRNYQDLPALYRAHDVFVFPSVSETFGHPMAEALATGLPIVAADTPINREICGDSALYFHPFAPSDLVRCVKTLDADPALRERMRSAATVRARQLYDWDAHVDRLVAQFEEVAARGKRRAAA